MKAEESPPDPPTAPKKLEVLCEIRDGIREVREATLKTAGRVKKYGKPPKDAPPKATPKAVPKAEPKAVPKAEPPGPVPRNIMQMLGAI